MTNIVTTVVAYKQIIKFVPLVLSESGRLPLDLNFPIRYSLQSLSDK